MPKTNGHLTKQKILETAEVLFAEYGYDATSISQISKHTKINKATIYYHFESKKSILHTLYENIILELNHTLQSKNTENLDDAEKIRMEINYLKSKKNIVAILLMESIKSKNPDNSLFQIAQEEMKKNGLVTDNYTKHDVDQIQIHEFFTGFIPVMLFVALEKKYCEFFNCNEEKALDIFIEMFTKTHLNNHIK